MAKKEEVKAYFCYNCKSTDVKYIFGFGNIFGVIPKMKCFNCNTIGMFPLVVIDKNKLNKMNARKKK